MKLPAGTNRIIIIIGFSTLYNYKFHVMISYKLFFLNFIFLHNYKLKQVFNKISFSVIFL